MLSRFFYLLLCSISILKQPEMIDESKYSAHHSGCAFYRRISALVLRGVYRSAGRDTRKEDNRNTRPMVIRNKKIFLSPIFFAKRERRIKRETNHA